MVELGFEPKHMAVASVLIITAFHCLQGNGAEVDSSSRVWNVRLV